MDPTHFDTMARSLTETSTRRTALSRLAGTALAVVAMRSPGVADARNKRKKRKKPSLNAYGCLNVGQACGGNSENCCSGVCAGKKPKNGKKDTSRCIAHDSGTCQVGQDTCEEVTVACGQPGAYCYRTSGNARFCGIAIGGACAVCARDTDCESTHGPGAACVVCPVSCGITTTGCIKAGA